MDLFVNFKIIKIACIYSLPMQVLKRGDGMDLFVYIQNYKDCCVYKRSPSLTNAL
jgi:hypothetical protein